MFLDALKLKGLAYHTRRWHKENLQAADKFLKLRGHINTPALVTEGMLKDIILAMVDQGLSNTTVNHRVRSLKQFFAHLKTEGIIKHNPADVLERKKKQDRSSRNLYRRAIKSFVISNRQN